MLKLREVETEISHHSAEAAKSTPIIYFVFLERLFDKKIITAMFFISSLDESA